MLKSVFVMVILLFFLGLKSSAAPKDVKAMWSELVRVETCQQSLDDENVVDGSDFRWNQPIEELNQRAEQLYHAGKRLPLRAFWDQDHVRVPIKTTTGLKTLSLTPHFILSVRRHIEEGLRRGYVDQIIFSDMGHSHLFIPKDYYQEVLSTYSVADRDLMYEKMLAYPGLKILYHTAEQLQMVNEDRSLINDRHLQWRFFTRNLVGDNRGLGKMEFIHQKDHLYNTGRDYEDDYRYWGAGFYLTANREGCFAYRFQGETRYFDLNLEGIDFSGNKNYNQRLSEFMQELMPD